MSMSSHLLERGISFWKNGQKEQARKIFNTIIYNDRQDDTAWIWYIYSLNTNKEKIAALETFLTIFPNHSVGKNALEKLKTENSIQRSLSNNARAKVSNKTTNIDEVRSLPVKEGNQSQQAKSRSIPWILLMLGACLLLFGSTIFISRYNKLQKEFTTLQSNNQLLSQNYNQLSGRHQVLQGDYQNLYNDMQILQNDFQTTKYNLQTLQDSYEVLQVEHQSLQDTYNVLLDDYNNTSNSYAEFREIAIAPPYIYTRERQVHLVFRKLDGTLLRWTISSDWLEHHLRRGDELRSDLTYSLKLFNKFTGETYNVVDDRDFIDSTPFTYLMADLYYDSQDDYTFIKEVWNIVAQLTAYTSEIQETPRFPMETLLSGGGDCEDHAILFASMILASPPTWTVEFTYMDGDNPTRPQTMNHVIVKVVTPSGTYPVEATSKFSMNPYDQGVVGWSYTISRTDQ